MKYFLRAQACSKLARQVAPFRRLEGPAEVIGVLATEAMWTIGLCGLLSYVYSWAKWTTGLLELCGLMGYLNEVV
jgi:hypothetical protein